MDKALAQGVAVCLGVHPTVRTKVYHDFFINLAGKRKEWRQYRDISKKWDILFIMTKTKWIHKKSFRLLLCLCDAQTYVFALCAEEKRFYCC